MIIMRISIQSGYPLYSAACKWATMSQSGSTWGYFSLSHLRWDLFSRGELMGISSSIPLWLTSDGGVEERIRKIYGWMMLIHALIVIIVKIHCWIAILTTINGWVSSDQATDGLKAPCMQTHWRPPIEICHMGRNNEVKRTNRVGLRRRAHQAIAQAIHALECVRMPHNAHDFCFLLVFYLSYVKWDDVRDDVIRVLALLVFYKYFVSLSWETSWWIKKK